MGQITRFYFRAKLDFRTPQAVKTVLQRQFDATGLGAGLHWFQVFDGNERDFNFNPEPGRATEAPEGVNWAGAGELEPHVFFSLPRAHAIPHSLDEQARTRPNVFRAHADGGARLELECAFKNYDQEIEHFLQWIKPYVRLRFGKRNRGRHRVWVGWYWVEGESRRANVFIEPCPTREFPGMLFGRRVCIDYAN